MRTLLLLVALALVAACAPFAPHQAPATPQRPTLSSDTSTTAVGTVEVEAGATVEPGDAIATPVALKWGAADRTELFAAVSPWVHVEQPGDDLDGTSDLQLGLRHRFVDADDGWPSAALQMVTKLPTANAEIGSGELDFFGAGIVTGQLGRITATAFYQLGVLGDPSGRGTDLGHDVALAGATTLASRWGVFAEVAGSFVPDLDVDAGFVTTGLTFAPRPSLVFDAGVIAGLGDDAPDLQVVFGCTINLGRLFGSRRP